MFSSLTPCIVRIATETWRCSHCDAIFIANDDSASKLLTALDAHVQREHRRHSNERPSRSARRSLTPSVLEHSACRAAVRKNG
jgi:hypothetical protein